MPGTKSLDGSGSTCSGTRAALPAGPLKLYVRRSPSTAEVEVEKFSPGPSEKWRPRFSRTAAAALAPAAMALSLSLSSEAMLRRRPLANDGRRESENDEGAGSISAGSV